MSMLPLRIRDSPLTEPTDTIIPMASELPLQCTDEQRQQTTNSDCCVQARSSISATLENWSPGSTFYSSPEEPSSDKHSQLQEARQSVVQRLFERSWIQPTIGITTLLVTLIALFVYSHRSFVMAKWTEENDMLQACAQLIEIRTNTTYPQCEEMLATGPRLPPYIRGNMYKPGAGAHRLAVRALKMIRKPHGSQAFQNHADADGVDIKWSNDLHPHGVLAIVLCAICAMAVVPAIFILAQKRRRWRRGPIMPTATQGSLLHAFCTFRLDPPTRHTERPAINVHYQPRRERVSKEIRLRLRRRRIVGSQSASPESAFPQGNPLMT
ncbi:MAG: hypothetical protein Q9186_005515 [Xanthomendoza sp. 1 TL-2023]